MDVEDDNSINVIRYRVRALEKSQTEVLIRVTGLELWKSKVEDLIKIRGGDPPVKENSKYNWAAIIIAALTALGLIAAAIK